jgi:gamma-D-glutamyl-L-lysine dipeptidyl-peptidase
MPNTAGGTPRRLSGAAITRSHTTSWPRFAVLAASALSLVAGCGSVTSAAAVHGAATPASGNVAMAAAAPAVCVSGTCWVNVSVATAWVKPWYPRAIDKPSLSNPAYPGTWIKNMSVAQKKWLVGKLESQAVYGTKVIVIGHWQNWAQVAIPSQPTNRDRRGYPGWIPSVQLTRTAPPAATTSAVISSGAAWLWSRWTAGGVAGGHVWLASYDTSFPVVKSSSTYVEVRLIGGQYVAIRRSDVVVRTTGKAWGVTQAKVVAEARKFIGLPYLWAGTSGFGFDCSGFTYSVYRAYGITLSRDADQQAVHGTPVTTRSALQPGDLVFFRGSAGGPISHVGMYIGGGNMIDSPGTGYAVRIEHLGSYASARRYLSR